VLTNSQWLSPITLPTVYGPATAFTVDADTLYVAYGQSAKRYSLAGSNEVHLINAANSIQGIFIDGNVIFLNHSVSLYARFTSLNKLNNAVIAQFENYIDAVSGASIAPSINKMFGRSLGVSPSDITYVSYNDDGTFVGGGDSPHHGDYPGASRTWVFPGDAKVVDDSGTVYSTGNLTYLNSFGGAITDLDFYGTNIPIVLRGSQLVAYSNALLPTGSHTLSFTPKNIYIVGTNVMTFTFDVGQSNGILVEAVALANLNPPTPGQPVNPVGLAYTPDASFIDKDGVLYLLSKAQQSLFRWDTTNQTYLATIPLVGSPGYVAYSAVNHTVYLAYSTGLIRQIDLSSTNFSETPFANLPSAPMGLSTADAYVFAVDGSGAWDTHYTFNSAGAMVDSVDWNYYSTEYVWNSARQKMYFFRDDTSPNDLLWEQINANGVTYSNEPPGGIGTYMDSPLHNSAGFVHPIRVAPDGTVVVLGSGVIHDATTLVRLATTLGNSITDAAWVNGQLRTIRTISGIAQLQQWTQPNYGLGNVRQLPGSAHRLLELGDDRLIAICLLGGVPSFYVLNGDFNIIAPPTLAAPSGLAATVASTSQVNLAWSDVSGEESYSIERKTGVAGNWAEIGTVTTSGTNYSDTTVTLGSQYFYRVISRNGGQSSAPSAEVLAAIVIPATPTNVTALTLSSSSIRVAWEDVEFEATYYLERKTGIGGTWAQVASFSANTIITTNTGLSPNTQYFYRLRAGNALGTSDYSAEAVATTEPVPPTTPSLTSATATGPFSVNLVWANVSYEEGYVIERRLGTNGIWGLLTNVAADVTSFVDGTVVPVTTYEYRLYATNIAGLSGYSNTKTVTTPQIPPPAAPTGLSAKSLNSSSVLITWNDVSVETGYRLERRTENTNSWAVVATLPPNTTYYTNIDLIQGVHYWFRVQAFNDYGNSPYSNEDDAVPANIVNLIADDFDPDLNSGVWASISGGVATNGGQGFRGSKALYFAASGVRSATTIPVDVTLGGNIEFLLRAGNEAVDGNALWNNSESGETVVLEYTKDNGITWTTIQTLNTVYPSLSNWTSFSVTIPASAFSPSTQFRWRQLANSGTSYDCWALEDLVIQGAAPLSPSAPPFILSSAISSNSIAIFWMGADWATAYIVERKLWSGDWTEIATLPVLVTYFTDTGLLPGTWYSYRVKGVNASGSSPFSAVTSSMTFQVAPNSKPYALVSGNYNGLFYEDEEVRNDSAGFFSTKVTMRGAYSGYFLVKGKRYAIAGQLSRALKATNVVQRFRTNWLTVNLSVEPGDQISGNVTDGDWVAALRGDRADYDSRTNPAPMQGAYTMIIPSQVGNDRVPAGYSYGTVKLNPSGKLTFVGALSDGTKISQSVPVSKFRQWPLYGSLSSGGEIALGWLTFTDRESDDLNGLLDWIKLPTARSRYYPAGFTNTCLAVGAVYLPPGRGTNVLGCTNAQIAFAGGNLSSGFMNLLTLGLNDKVTNTSSNRISMRFFRTTGIRLARLLVSCKIR